MQEKRRGKITIEGDGGDRDGTTCDAACDAIDRLIIDAYANEKSVTFSIEFDDDCTPELQDEVTTDGDAIRAASLDSELDVSDLHRARHSNHISSENPAMAEETKRDECVQNPV